MAKRLGILTSGGDCAGLNAALRACVNHADQLGWEVVCIRNGTDGLRSDPPNARVMKPADFDSQIFRQAGTILGTSNKGNPFDYPENGTTRDVSDDIIRGLNSLNITGLIGIGGDGSLEILNKLARKGGFRIIGIPKTIDNDLGVTETSIGFDTAVSVATEALDRLQPTAASHDRIMVLEVMGRDAGHIALHAGIAGAADIILIPEIPYKIENLAAKIRTLKERGRNFALIIVSEAVKTPEGARIERQYFGGQVRHGGIGHYVGDALAEMTQSETRVTVLGHVQRGSQPTWNDRMLASALGVHAVDLAEQGKFGRMVAWANRSVVDVPIEEATAGYQEVDVNGTLVRTARALGISLGD